MQRARPEPDALLVLEWTWCLCKSAAKCSIQCVIALVIHSPILLLV